MDAKKGVIILIAEDDDDQYELTSSALSEYRLSNQLRRVVDGEELMNYLLRREEYHNEQLYPWPGLILLDLNMPKKDGRETLKEIKSHPQLRTIPVVVLTVSKDEEDVRRMYDLGANSFITKPLTFTKLVEAMKALERFWLEIVELPRLR